MFDLCGGFTLAVLLAGCALWATGKIAAEQLDEACRPRRRRRAPTLAELFPDQEVCLGD